MNTHEAAFMAEISAHHEDDAPRLLFADWLDENGQPERAEFVRVQVALARLYATTDDGGAREDALRRRERELLGKHFGEWTDGLPESLVTKECPHCQEACPDPETNAIECLQCDGTGVVLDDDRLEFRHGFVEAIECTAADWLAHADALTAAAPIREVRLTTWPNVSVYGELAKFFDRKMKPVYVGGPAGLLMSAVSQVLLKTEWPRIAFTLPPAGLTEEYLAAHGVHVAVHLP